MSRKGPEVGKGMFDFVEDYFVDVLFIYLFIRRESKETFEQMLKEVT